MGRKSLIGPNTILSINVLDYKRIAAHKYQSQHRRLVLIKELQLTTFAGF
jgi:hypothetical protein